MYNSGKHRLAPLREPDPRERLGKAKGQFGYWMTKAKVFKEDSLHNLSKHSQGQEYLNQSAFLLHQAAENLYHTLLLVFTGYKAKLHDLEKLGHLTNSFGKALLTIFPTATESERLRFNLLKKAYTEARYEPGYRITKEDLDYLVDRVRLLREAVKLLCEQRIAKYEEEARAFQLAHKKRP